TQPSNGLTNSTLTKQPVVKLEDSSNNVVLDSTHTVTVALTTPGGASLGGTLTLTLVNGVATFTNLTVDTAGTYTLTPSTNVGAGVTGLAASSSFAITGAATQLVFSTQPVG